MSNHTCERCGGSGLLDVYGDPAPSELYDSPEGLVDVYGDPAPSELYNCPDCDSSEDGFSFTQTEKQT